MYYQALTWMWFFYINRSIHDIVMDTTCISIMFNGCILKVKSHSSTGWILEKEKKLILLTNAPDGNFNNNASSTLVLYVLSPLFYRFSINNFLYI